MHGMWSGARGHASTPVIIGSCDAQGLPLSPFPCMELGGKAPVQQTRPMQRLRHAVMQAIEPGSCSASVQCLAKLDDLRGLLGLMYENIQMINTLD